MGPKINLCLFYNLSFFIFAFRCSHLQTLLSFRKIPFQVFPASFGIVAPNLNFYHKFTNFYVDDYAFLNFHSSVNGSKTWIFFFFSSAKSQKGINAVQQCSAEKRKGAITIEVVQR